MSPLRIFPANPGFTAVPTPSRRSKIRAPVACEYCRGRKVRCDLNQRGVQCTNCELDNVKCWVAENRKRRKGTASQRQNGDDTSKIRTTTNRLPELPRLGDQSSENGSAEKAAAVTIPADKVSISSLESQDQLHHSSLVNGGIGSEVVPEMPFRASLDLSPLESFISRQIPDLPPFITPLDAGISQSALDYLSREGAFCLPEPDSRQVLLDACFEFAGPYMPSLDRKLIFAGIDVRAEPNPSVTSDHTVGILLFQAMLFAGSAFVDMADLPSENYHSQREMRRELYRRTRLLYDFDIFGTHLEVLQALLLLSFWYEDADDIKDAWYWLGSQISLSHQFGLSDKAESKHQHQSHYRKLWWSSFMRDTHMAMGLRLPTRLKQTIRMLTVNDFLSDTESEGGATSVVAREYAMICVRMAELSVCVNNILSHNDAASSSAKLFSGTEALDLELMEWYQLCCSENPWVFSREAAEDPTRGISVGRILLCMTFYTATYVLYLPHLSQRFSKSRSEVSSSQVTRISYQKVQAAASKVADLAGVMLDNNLVGFIPTQGITCVLPSTSILLLNLKTPNTPLRKQSTDGLRTCIRFLERLGERYAASSTVLNNLRSALKKANISIDPQERQSTPCQPRGSQNPPPVSQILSLDFQPHPETSQRTRQYGSGDLFHMEGFDYNFDSTMSGMHEVPPAMEKEYPMSAELYKDPFFHSMSTFLTIEPSFSTSPLGMNGTDKTFDDLQAFQIMDEVG